MTDYTLLLALRALFSSPPQEKLLYVGGEPWIRDFIQLSLEVCLSEKSYIPRFQTISLNQLQHQFQEAFFGFYAPMKASCHRVETETFGKEEDKLFRSLAYSKPACLLWFTDKLTESCPYAVVLSKCKPWEKEAQARQAVEALAKQMNISVTPLVVKLLSEKAQARTLSSELEKYALYSSSGAVEEHALEGLFGQETPCTLWSLFDALLFRKKKEFFEGLSALEEQGETHPLPMVRFFRSQLERCIQVSESSAPLSFKSQEKQREAWQSFSFDAKRHLLQNLALLDESLRDGTVDGESSLMPFFVQLWNKLV